MDDLKENYEDLISWDSPCKFYKEYVTDINLRIGKKIEFGNRTKILKELFSKSQWLENICGDSSDPYGKCIGNCGKLNTDYKYIKYNGYFRTLCIDCFINKNNELKKIYGKRGKCLI